MESVTFQEMEKKSKIDQMVLENEKEKMMRDHAKAELEKHN